MSKTVLSLVYKSKEVEIPLHIEQLYIVHNKAVYQFIYFLVGEEQLAQDLTQETFLKAISAKVTFREQASEKTWLMKIARNAVIDQFRRKRIVKFIPFLKEHEEIDYTYAPEARLVKQSEQFALYKALGELPYAYREAIVLRKIEGFSIKETAHILGWTESKVKNATERGVKKLRDILGGEQDD